MKKFNIFEFQIGKVKRTIYDYAKTGVIFRGILDVFSLLPFVTEEQIFNFIDAAQLKFGVDILNEYIIGDPKLLDYRIKRILDQAFETYKKELDEHNIQ